MKKYFLFILVFIALVFTDCKKDKNKNHLPDFSSIYPGNPNNPNPNPNNPNNPNPNTGGIFIKGCIPQQKSGGGSRSLADAKKVLVFSKYYYNLVDISDGSFSIPGQIGSGVALIFLDIDNHYIGHFSSQGINILPLGNLTNGANTTIDLSTLTLVGNTVIPSHDPFGNEIIISPTEINSLKVVGTYYESIAKNIDANNDNIPDVLSNTQLVVTSRFAIYAGRWGRKDTLPRMNDSAHYYVQYQVEVAGGSGLSFSNGNIALSGPSVSPYSDLTTWGYMMSEQVGGNRGFMATFGRLGVAQSGAPWGTAFLPIKKGTYTLTLDGTKNYTLDYSNIDVKYNLVIIIPTLHTNTEGKLTSITLEYKLPDGTPINPASILTNVMLQMVEIIPGRPNPNQFFNSEKLSTATGFSVINLNTPIDISNLHQMDIWYDDFLGNQQDIIWN